MAMMMSLTALSIDAMLPALPIIGAELGVQHPNDNHLIISALFLGISIGQFFYGPISDSVGRKKPLYVGLIIFLLGTTIALLSSSFKLMLIGRWLQGFGLASPRTVSVAMIRDQYEGRKMAQTMSFIMMIFILVPTIAPALGQCILLFFDWRYIFVFFFLMALFNLSWFYSRMHETLTPSARKPFSIRRIAQGFREVLKHKVALSYIITAGLISAPFIAFLNISQQLFQVQYNLGAQFPLYFACIALTFGLASLFNARMVLKHGMQKMITTAVLCLVSLALLMAVYLYYSTTELSLFYCMCYLLTTLFCEGILFANLNSLAMQPLGHIAGIAAALVGALSTLISVLIGTFISAQYQLSLEPIVFGFLICGILSSGLIFWVEAHRQ